jgi:hypothetical protein
VCGEKLFLNEMVFSVGKSIFYWKFLLKILTIKINLNFLKIRLKFKKAGKFLALENLKN